MKKIIYLFFVICLCSCVDYLDKSPESGLSEDVVFSKLENTKKYFRSVYDRTYPGANKFKYYSVRSAFPLCMTFCGGGTRWGLETLTDFADSGRDNNSHQWKRGEIMGTINYLTYSQKNSPIWANMFQVIRVCNKTLENIDRVIGASDVEINDLKGQAYFIRGFAHFSLIRLWGPMPYIDHALTGDESWDLPRLTIKESYERVVDDMDLAYEYFEKAGKIRRDPLPGEPGHLEDPDQDLPTGVAAKAMKARALLYAASPLNNTTGDELWKKAADAAWDALQLAQKYGYTLMSLDNYTDNFYGISKYCNEHIWAWNAGKVWYNSSQITSILTGKFQERVKYSVGECPSQNLVDKFETIWGDPLTTEEERAVATSLGHYNEQDPYANRDPRLTKDVIYNQAPMTWPKVWGDNVKDRANLFYTVKPDGKISYSDLLSRTYQGYSRTGYCSRKYTGDISGQKKSGVEMTDPLLRLGELYLIYAETVNEAYGPSGMAPGATITAIDAVNIVRERAGMPGVLTKFTGDKDAFRERIKNERSVELCMEGGHRYFDMRRWKDAPEIMSKPIYGIDVQKVTKSSEYPTGFRYKRVVLPDNRQTKWYDFMYYLPFNPQEYDNLVIFDTSLNPKWY